MNINRALLQQRIYGAIAIAATITLLLSCRNNESKKIPNHPPDETIANKPRKKAPSSYQDTLTITKTAAVFYRSDSIQLLKTKKLYDSVLFETMEHEYLYQAKNARSVISTFWPHIPIVEASTFRYLLFIKSDKGRRCFDMDEKNETRGIFLFEPAKDPNGST
jgi:hypothetical protein